ncbi:RPA-interacting protein B-like [Acanthaster planci]|uniref:RPA-interacting protein B-like n=1 Tax=Acanthaster planci TaxID=133434 RepID=A0A8B7ZW52_ACAPL|nr:RPA-interacting protein B-like [Acanthaster planci]
MATPRGKSPTFSRMEKHRNLYKNTSPQSCMWRDTYRRRCFERLKNSRENLLQKFRGNDASADGASPGRGSVICELMEEEWKLMQWEERQARVEMKLTHGQMDDGLLEDLNNDVVLSIMEELQRELIAEEGAIIAEYEASLHLAEASLSATVEQLNTDELLCPICKRNPLMLNKGVIFCACGMRINTEQDCITLANVRQQLESGVEQHSALCHGQPVFTVTDALSAQNLVLSCQTCDFLYIVI